PGRLRHLFRRSPQAAHDEKSKNGPVRHRRRPRAALQAVEGIEAGGPLNEVPPTRSLAVLVALAALLAPLLASAQALQPPSPNGRPVTVSAGSALVVDPEGRVLFAKNAEDERAPASLVKLMTLYLAYEDLDRGQVDIEEPVQRSHYAALTPTE